MRKIPIFLVILATAGCSVVRTSFVRPDYEQVDRTKTVRLALVTAPLPGGSEKVGALWSEIARKYANDHRDFIVKVAKSGAEVPASLCEDQETPIEGVLVLVPTAKLAGAGAEVSVAGKLTRCAGGETVWSVEAGGSWSSDDATLVEVRRHYVDKYGEEVSPWVAPTFQLLRAALDTLPQPKLDEKGVDEKIELED